MEYILPDKSLLEKNSLEIENEKKYYNLSKLIFKKDNDNKLLFPIGIDETKEKYYMDFSDKTSMFIVGETGSGKSVFLNSIIVSLLMKNTPSDLEFIFIDPRNVELNLYNDIPHLYKNSFSTPDESINAFNYIIDNMERRKKAFESKNVETIKEYNEISEEKLPHILLVIDEAIDILDSKKVESVVNEIIPDGYKFGIHLIISTNSYIKNCFTPETIKSFNSIVSFDLASKEQANLIKISNSDLLSIQGEALIKCKGKDIINIQAPYVSDKDIKEVVDFIKKQIQNENYLNKIINIKIDRPFGSRHHKHEFIYPVNYGYVPNTISGDGEELDAYLLGVFEPVEEFEGECIAIIHRTNDNDDKLVVVPKGKNYSDDAIDALTEFQEQYFEHKIIRK